MSYQYSRTSRARLETCDPRLQQVFDRVLELGLFDVTILEGHRNEGDQNRFFAEGKSKLKWPEGKHNTKPSKAVDAAPYFADGRKIPWDDTGTWDVFGGVVLATAASLGIKLRWGGDWDGDFTHKDQSFHDKPHFELVDD